MMKVVKAEIKLPQHLSVHKVDVSRDELYKDARKRGRKIVSQNRALDTSALQKIKERKIHKLWIKRSYPQWVTAHEASKRNLPMLETRDVSVERGKMIKKISQLNTVQELTALLNRYLSQDLPAHRQKKILDFIDKLEELKPEVKRFRQNLASEEDEKKKIELAEQLKKPPEQLQPINFPKGYREGFARRYLNYQGQLLEVKKEISELVMNSERMLVKALVG